MGLQGGPKIENVPTNHIASVYEENKEVAF
jgi:hypothetical protein